MLDRSQWIAIGLVSGFAYILGKDRESFDAESFEAHESIYAGDAGDILEIKLVSPARGELIWTPEKNEFAEFIISYEGRRRECSIVSDSIYNNLVGKSLVCDRNNHTISGKTKESGFPVTVTFGNIPTFNRICSMIEDKFNAESFEAEKKNCGCGQDPCVTYGAEPCDA